MTLSKHEYYEDLEVDLVFDETGPAIGDLFLICGYPNPSIPPEGVYDFSQFEDLQFSQADDYFGVWTVSEEDEVEEGEDVAVWLFPLKNGKVVHHHRGPFDALRVSYNVLRNPIHRADHFRLVLSRLTQSLPVNASVPSGKINDKIDEIENYWKKQGITVGTDAALMLDPED